MQAGQRCLALKLLATPFSPPYPLVEACESFAALRPNTYSTQLALTFLCFLPVSPPCLPTDDGTTPPATQVRTHTAPYRALRLLSNTLAV